jgi:hypothetical protein
VAEAVIVVALLLVAASATAAVAARDPVRQTLVLAVLGVVLAVLFTFVVTSVHWTPAGVLLGLLSTALAVGLAAVAVTRPKLFTAPGWALPLRRLQSGHVGDYVAWLLVGTTVLGALALPAILAS